MVALPLFIIPRLVMVVFTNFKSAPLSNVSLSEIPRVPSKSDKLTAFRKVMDTAGPVASATAIASARLP